MCRYSSTTLLHKPTIWKILLSISITTNSEGTSVLMLTYSAVSVRPRHFLLSKKMTNEQCVLRTVAISKAARETPINRQWVARPSNKVNRIYSVIFVHVTTTLANDQLVELYPINIIIKLRTILFKNLFLQKDITYIHTNIESLTQTV